jgi:multidrug resistance efflux pump
MKKKIGLGILSLMLLSGISYGVYTYMDSVRYVTTEDARIDAELVKVSPEISGRVLDVRAKEGDLVNAGETLARLEEKNTTLQNRDSALVRAPIAGKVIKRQVNEGELASPGQRLFLLANPSNLFVSARIEETKLRRIAVGQEVQFTVDAFPGKTLSGVVEEVGFATDSVFSLLPTSNVSGNFIKVTQRIPIKIKIIDAQGLNLLPGMNSVVKIATGG